jgi:hypothetical protein
MQGGTRYRIGTLLGSVLAVLLLGPASAQNAIRVVLNSTPIDFGGAAPEEVDNRVLVPLRSVFEAMGARVDYDAGTRVIAASRGSRRILLTIDSVHATVNGQAYTLDVPAQVRSERTLIPLRFVSESLGADVRWKEADRTVVIVDAPQSPALPPATRGPEGFINLASDPPGAEVYLVSEYDWETIPNIDKRIDEDPDFADDQVSEGPTDIVVPRPLIVYRAIFIQGGVRRVAPVQPVPILAGQQRKGWVRFR